MNYADDRRDRRSSGIEIDEVITKSLKAQNHTELAHALRDKGRNMEALHHYYIAILITDCSDDCFWEKIGDYATMANLAGHSFLGVIPLLAYRNGVTEWPEVSFENTGIYRERTCSKVCPCSHPACSFDTVSYHTQLFRSHEGFLPLLGSLHRYVRALSEGIDMPHSNEIWKAMQKNSFVELPDCQPHIPDLLRFWENQPKGRYLVVFPLVLQILLVKLLYECLPPLAVEAVVRISMEDVDKIRLMYKSHHAYFVLIHAMVMGREPIKVGRRMTMKSFYHVPIWDLLFRKDRRRDLTLTHRGDEWLQFFHNYDPLSPTLESLHLPPFSIEPLYVIGDSHVLSIAYQICCLAGKLRVIFPLVITGLKAWHCQSSGVDFFTNTCFKDTLARLSTVSESHRHLLISAGEIDCREGLGGILLEGYDAEHSVEHIRRTVAAYVAALQEYNSFEFLVMPVAPHALSKKGRVKGQAFRRTTTKLWNQTLRDMLPAKNLFFVDYCEQIRDHGSEEYVLSPVFDADSTHMSSAFIPHLEKAVEASGCNLD